MHDGEKNIFCWANCYSEWSSFVHGKHSFIQWRNHWQNLWKGCWWIDNTLSRLIANSNTRLQTLWCKPIRIVSNWVHTHQRYFTNPKVFPTYVAVVKRKSCESITPRGVHQSSNQKDLTQKRNFILSHINSKPQRIIITLLHSLISYRNWYTPNAQKSWNSGTKRKENSNVTDFDEEEFSLYVNQST